MKSKIKKAFLAEHPVCCFCGGNEASQTIEHQPARIIFPNWKRPAGMLYPSCERCNKQTRNDDLLVAAVARLTGSRLSEHKPDKSSQGLPHRINSLFPGLVERMLYQEQWIKDSFLLRKRGIFDLSQPEIDFSFCRLAAKTALCTYYDIINVPATNQAQIRTFWTHNQRRNSITVEEALKMLPLSSAISQGAFQTEETYFRRFSWDGVNLFVIAVFHESLALVAQLAEPGSPESMMWQMIWQPTAETGLNMLKIK